MTALMVSTRSSEGQAEDGEPWVQYEWSEPVNINKVEVYWAVDHPRPGAIPGSRWPTIHVPQSYRILYWNGTDFVPVNQAAGPGAGGRCVQRHDFRRGENHQAAP